MSDANMISVGRPFQLLFSFVAFAGCNVEDSGQETSPSQAAGCDLYQANCAECHGVRGKGDGPHGQHHDPMPTNLVGAESQARPREQRIADIRDGVGSGMPSFGGSMTDVEIESILIYVDALAAGNATCTEPTESETGHGHPSDHGTTSGTPEDTETSGTSGATAVTSDSTDDTGSAGESSMDVSPECEAWCGCLETSCSEFAEYPFSSTDDCLGSCAELTELEISCWQGFCDEVSSDPALAGHLCDHAWGALGLVEC